MGNNSPSLTLPPDGYSEWLKELKDRIYNTQQRATLSVNRELIMLYWEIGNDILIKQSIQGWGAKVIERFSKDLQNAFPSMKGFSTRNLKYMRSFAEVWTDKQIVQQAVA
jgi:predicted nuclease of restriction endonuclease-like (RecB) superfamily